MKNTRELPHARRGIVCAGAVAGLAAVPAFATLTADLAPGQPVYTTVTWTLEPNGAADEDYRFEVVSDDGTVRVMYDYQPSNVFAWTPIDQGPYLLRGTVRNRETGETEVSVAPFRIKRRVTTEAAVFATSHPMVALYSAPPCGDGNTLQVFFSRAGAGEPPFTTNAKACSSQKTTNLLVAGMREQTAYAMRQLVRGPEGNVLSVGEPLVFRTRAAELRDLPEVTIDTPPTAAFSAADRVIAGTVTEDIQGGAPQVPFAVDVAGELIWYYRDENRDDATLMRTSNDGSMWILLQDHRWNSMLEIDPVGNVLRKSRSETVREQLPPALENEAYGDIHHEITELPNGDIMVLLSVERLLEDVQGPGIVDVIGDMVIVMDRDMQVKWSWNGFDHLDPARKALLGEQCTDPDGGGGCPPYDLADIAEDWMHSNSIGYSPADGDLVVSVRHQDWILKINYDDGTGDGSLIWRMGEEGDLSTDSADPYPWQSHQHDVEYIADSVITIYDNGNLNYDCQEVSENCVSRGLVFAIDEENRRVTPLLEGFLDKYAFALGAAQVLSNGNFSFHSGIVGFPNGAYTVVDELTAEGEVAYALRVDGAMYRSFRAPNLYTDVR